MSIFSFHWSTSSGSLALKARLQEAKEGVVGIPILFCQVRLDGGHKEANSTRSITYNTSEIDLRLRGLCVDVGEQALVARHHDFRDVFQHVPLLREEIKQGTQ